MNKFKKSIFAAMAVVAGISLTTACSDANEYEDALTDNPSWVTDYNDSLAIAHPETLASTRWVRANGVKTNAYGEEMQGFVESLNFATADSVSVKMSQGATQGTYTDESNTDALPYYEYTYSATTGSLQILKLVRDDKGNISKSPVFEGVAVSGSKDIITIVHYGDTPTQTYLVRQ